MLNCVVSWIDSGVLVSRLSPGGLGWMVSEEIASHGLRDAPFLRPLGGGLDRTRPAGLTSQRRRNERVDGLEISSSGSQGCGPYTVDRW